MVRCVCSKALLAPSARPLASCFAAHPLFPQLHALYRADTCPASAQPLYAHNHASSAIALCDLQTWDHIAEELAMAYLTLGVRRRQALFSSSQSGPARAGASGGAGAGAGAGGGAGGGMAAGVDHLVEPVNPGAAQVCYRFNPTIA